MNAKSARSGKKNAATFETNILAGLTQAEKSSYFGLKHKDESKRTKLYTTASPAGSSSLTPPPLITSLLATCIPSRIKVAADPATILPKTRLLRATSIRKTEPPLCASPSSTSSTASSVKTIITSRSSIIRTSTFMAAVAAGWKLSVLPVQAWCYVGLRLPLHI